MQEKQIPFNGITLTPYSDISPDGQLSDSQNMELYNGALRPSTINGKSYPGFEGYTLVHIHTTPNYQHYIFEKDDSPGSLYFTSDLENPKNLQNPRNQICTNEYKIKSIEHVGNYICILDTQNVLTYFLCEYDKYYKTGDFNVNLQFYLEQVREDPASLTWTAKDGEIVGDGVGTNNDWHFESATKQEELEQKVFTAANNLIQTSKQSGCIPSEIFFLRYAIKLKGVEESYTNYSPIIMMIPSSISPIRVYWNTVKQDSNNSGVYYTFNFRISHNSFSLKCINNTILNDEEIELFSKTIESVDIFITKHRTFSKLHILGSDTTDFSYQNFGIFRSKKELNGNRFVQIHDLNRNFVLSTVDNDNNEIIDYDYFPPSASLLINPEYEEYEQEAVFYKICSLKLEDFKKDEITINTSEITDETPQLSEKWHEFGKLYPSGIFSYNKRLVKYNLRKFYENTISSYLHFPYTNGFTSIEWDDIENPNIYDKSTYTDIKGYVTIDIFLKKEGKIMITRNQDKNVNIFLNKIWYFYFPDPDAYKVVIIYQNDGSFKKSITLELKEHPFLSGAYWFAGLNYNDGMSFTDGIPNNYVLSDKNQLSLQEDNHLYLSEVSDPLTYADLGKNIIGAGAFVAISSVVTPLSQGQYGQYPLMALCTDGNYALRINDEGLIIASPPMKRDVCINPNSVTQIDGAIIYVAERGVMIADGNDIQCISQQLTGVPDKFTQEDEKTTVIRPMELFRVCQVIFDYVNQRLIFFDPTNQIDFSLVYSLSSGTWNNITVLDFIKAINIYPYSYIQDKNGNIILIDQSYDFLPTQQPIEGKIITRPLKLDTLQFKRLTAFALQGIFKDKQEISLYGSNDATTWRFLGKTQRAAVNNITGRTYKYFRFVISTSLTPEENISGLRLQYEIRREKRLR